MSRGTDGIWWISFPLDDGEYEYCFEVTREAGQVAVLVADPMGMRFASNNDERSVVEILNGQSIYFRYQWRHNHVDLVPNEKLIIYEMHIGDFRGGPGDDGNGPGTFERVIQKLDYLTDLGITGLELMPITQAEPNDNWGYSQHSLYGVENTYVTPDYLARLA